MNKARLKGEEEEKAKKEQLTLRPILIIQQDLIQKNLSGSPLAF